LGSCVAFGISESESVETEHGDDVVGNWVEFVSEELLDLWNDVMNMSTVEVGVVEHVLDDFCVSADIDLFSGLDEGSEHDPVVLVEGLDLELEMFKRSLPVAHEQVVFVLDLSCPFMDTKSIKDQNEVIVNTVGSAAFTLTDINMFYCGGRRNNFILLDDIIPS